MPIIQDVNDWNSAFGNSIRRSAVTGAKNLAQYSGPGGWNDPDAVLGSSPAAAVHATQTQSRTQFSLWAMLAAPLQIGSNILNMSAYDLETFKNTEGERDIRRSETLTSAVYTHIYARLLPPSPVRSAK